jgi:hypothetical protein
MPLTSSSFDSARLKVQRANRHIENLQAVIADFSADKFYEFVVDGNLGAIVTRLLKPFPDDVPLIIGDAVHNMRSALDHTVTAIVQSTVKQRDRLFPFHKDRKCLVSDTAKLDPIEKSLAGAKRLIVDEAQSYEGGNGNLYGLHLLDRIDKHNEIIVTTAIAFADRLIVRENGRVVMAVNKIVFDVKSPILSIGSPANFSVDYDGKSAIEIRFAKHLPFGAEPVIPTLVDLSQRVMKIIELFAAIV